MQNTYFTFSNFFPRKSCRLSNKMWKKCGTDRQAAQVTVWRMLVACCIDKATNTHSEYVILIASALQEGVHELVSILHLRLSGYVVPLVQQ